MTFPVTELPVKVELELDGVWTDVTAYTRVEDKVAITRGRRGEAGSFEPGECVLVFNNQAGRFSPRNPTGPYYGVLGRNTPVRVSARVGRTRMVTPAITTDFAQAPDSAGLSVTGDIDLRVDMRLPGVDSTARPIRKFATAGSGSYSFQIVDSGVLRLFWSTDGTATLFMDSLVPLPRTTGRLAIRVTLDVNNGAGGRTATFYYADSISGTWMQLGDAVTVAGTTNIFDGTSPVTIGLDCPGEVYAAEIRNGIAGALVGSPTFTGQTDGAASFNDAQGNTWTLNGDAVISDRRYRFYGEVPSWPQQWDLSERNVWVPVQAAGVLRRLGQGAAPLLGPIQRAVLKDNVAAYGYWPMEDATGSAAMASGLTGGPAMGFTGSPELAASEVFYASAPLPVVNGAVFTGTVLPHADTGTVRAQCLLHVPAALGADSGVIMRVFTTGTAARWDLVYSGGLTLNAYDGGGVLLFTQAVGFTVQGQVLAAIIEMVQDGADIDWKMVTLDNGSDAGFQFTGTLASRTIGHATTIQVNPTGVMTTEVVGHVLVTAALPTSDVEEALRGYAGEAAGRRVERLCEEEDITFTAYGDLDESIAMGIQRQNTLLELLAECEVTDLGQVFESREHLGLCYRTRDSRQYQAATLALAYGNLSELVPVEDDQGTRNDVTVSRIGGSSARVTIDTGPLSTLPPPDGVGRYDESVEVSLNLDTQCADLASWRATAGTIDEPRYPVIHVHLAGTAFAASQVLTDAALDVEHGDLITVTGAPVWVPPGTIEQHTIGQVETLGVRTFQIDFVCMPATPAGATGLYDVADDTEARYSPTEASLTSGITSTATGAAALSITTPAGDPLWTSDAADFPLDIVIGGERITLSAIAATASPQAADVSARSVNGVVKAHLAGAAIDIADPVYYSL